MNAWRDFLDSWPLLGDSWLAGWLIAAVLGATGVWVVARDQVFVGAAVAQASAFGVALVIAASGWLGIALPEESTSAHAVIVSSTSIVAAMVAALATARWGRPGRESHEAITGWVYLAAASCGMILVANSPHGVAEVARLVGSNSIIGVSAVEVWLFAVLALVAAVVLATANRRLVLLSLDPAFATALGVAPRRTAAGFALWLGLVTGASIHAAGVLYAFGCLILPALIAKRWCRELRATFVCAPLVAVATTVVAFVVANHRDLPPGQAAVALLALLTLASWLLTWRRLRRARTADASPSSGRGTSAGRSGGVGADRP